MSCPHQPSPAEQIIASDPTRSAWVAAAAGTGKTHVLTSRVLRLLLAGAPAERILCLTFTKAAAAEMTHRIFQTLAQWTQLDDTALMAALTILLDRAPDIGETSRARVLFAQVLDAPGGMRIDTLHAFCQSVLARFPVEAEVSPYFEALEEHEARALYQDAFQYVLAEAHEGHMPLAQKALAALSRDVNEEQLRGILSRLDQGRGRLAVAEQMMQGTESVQHSLRLLLDAPETNPEVTFGAMFGPDGSLKEDLRQLADGLLQGSEKTDVPAGQRILDWFDLGDRETLVAAFLTQKGEPRKRIPTKQAAPVTELYARLQTQIGLVVRQMSAQRLFVRTGHGLALHRAVSARYAELKQHCNALDYDDLILRTRALLTRAAIRPWVLYKLDPGLEHILLDEAQDTNRDQWDVVSALCEEFFSGEGRFEDQMTKDRPARTVFAVGDPKQSIFGFQRAEPREFVRSQQALGSRVRQAGRDFAEVSLTESFRSAPPILQLVDKVFEEPGRWQRIAFNTTPLPHIPRRRDAPGLVELWPLKEDTEPPDEAPWEVFLKPIVTESAEEKLAQHIADTVASWIQNKRILPARNRPITEGDVLILFRKRSSLFVRVLRALKQRSLKVAGADRMNLTAELAVEDLVAAGKFALLPDDDYTLSVVLKGPFIGFEDDDLYRIAQGRPNHTGSLWHSLRQHAVDDPKAAAAVNLLTVLLNNADQTPVFEFYSHLLGPLGGRRHLLKRLGPEAADPVDEFLSQALRADRDGPSSLQTFLADLTADETFQIKRDMEQGHNEIRLMTVHGAKGLQAPVVILPDTTSGTARTGNVFWMETGQDLPPLPVVAPRTESDEPQAVLDARQAVKDQEADESLRLLYVALTRAEDELYVGGTVPGRNAGDENWYALVSDALASLPDVEEDRDTGGLLRFQRTGKADKDIAAGAGGQDTLTAAPGWLRRPAPEETALSRPLAPSRPDDEEGAARSPLRGTDEGRFQRGLLIHRLLEFLPDLPATARQDAAARFLAQPGHGLTGAQQQSIRSETLTLLDHPDFAPLFGATSQAEVSVTGIVGGRVITGQVDRLVVTDDAVLIIDYKTNRPAPRQVADVPRLYLRQMAAYSQILGKIYGDRPVRCALLWTEHARLMPLPAELLADALPVTVA